MKNTVFAIIIAVLGALLFQGCASSEAKKPKSDSPFGLLARGKVDEAKNLYRGKADVQERDEEGRTALHVAAEMGNSELASFLITMGAEVDALDNQGRTPLAICVFSPENWTKEGASDAGYEWNGTSWVTKSRMAESGGKDYPGTAGVLAAAGADIHRPLTKDFPVSIAISIIEDKKFLDPVITSKNVLSADSSGRTVLHIAAQAGADASVDLLLERGARVNAQDKEGKRPLDYTFERTGSVRHARTAEKLIRAGAASDHPFYAALAPAARGSNYNIRLADGSTAIHYASGAGYAGFVRFFIEKNADVNVKNGSGSTPLHEAARSGHIAVMETLLEAGAEADAQDAKGNTAMHLAIPPGQQQAALELLFSWKANPNLKDEHGDNPLQVAVTLDRSSEVVEALLTGGSDVSNRDIEGKTALYIAVEENRAALIPILLAWKSDVYAADNTGLSLMEKAVRENKAVLPALITEETVLKSDGAGNTILHLAVKNKADSSVTARALEKKAAVQARNREGNTALHIAVRNNDEASGSLLLARGADIFGPNAAGESPLYLAFHSPGRVRDWMLNQKTMEARDGLGNTALHHAAQWKLAGHVPLMVSRGARLEAANATGETPVFWAARSDSPETVNALVKQGAALGARDSLGNTCLHSAVRWNARKTPPVLAAAGIPVNAQNLAGKSPLHEAVKLGLGGMEEDLFTLGANIELRDNEGNTPLMEAVMGGGIESAERLTGRGADPVTRNNSGDTPLHIAVLAQNMDIVNLLLRNGAPIHARNSRGWTPFTSALGISPAMISALLTKDRLYAADDDGFSPLHIAVKQHASPAVITTIINKGCRISAVDREGRTPLRLALDAGLLGDAKILADGGSDVFAIATDGKTPADLALSGGTGAVEAVFSGAAVGARDNSGNTVLHYAAKTGNTAAISLLIRLGADRSIRNIAAESPAEIARRWNQPGAAGLLQEPNPR